MAEASQCGAKGRPVFSPSGFLILWPRFLANRTIPVALLQIMVFFAQETNNGARVEDRPRTQLRLFAGNGGGGISAARTMGQGDRKYSIR